MPSNYILKDYDGGAEKTTLTAALTSSASSFSVVDGSSFPPGTNPFVVVIDRGLATEEKILIGSRVGGSFNVLERAYDGSSAQTHALGAVVEHCLDAFTIEQANRYVNLQTTKGDLVSFDGTTSQRLAVGANNTILVADSAQSNGIKWAQVEADSISAGAITAIAAQVEGLISPSGVPAGVITQFAGSTAPTGWLLCQGQTNLSITGQYAALFDAIGYAYGGSGSVFSLPNLKGKVPVGLNSAEGEFLQLGQTGGAKTHTLITAEMPRHLHTATTSTDGRHQHFYSDHPRNPSLQSSPGSGIQDRDAETEVTSFEGNHDHDITVGYTGGSTVAGQGTPHNNIQPYIVVNYIIKY